MNRKLFKIIAGMMALTLITVNALAADAPASVQAKPFHLKGNYSIKYGILPVGQLAVDGAHEGASFHIDARAKLAGIAKVISSHKSNNQIIGTLSDAGSRDFAHAKREFQTNYTSKDEWKTITLGYDANGSLIKEELSAEETSPRPEVPAADKNGVPDTMTMVLVVREKIYQADQNGQKEIVQNFYDGKRLSKVEMQIYGVVNRTWKGIKTPVLKVGFLREPIAGYTEKELKRAREKPMGELLIYFTANDDFIPVLGELPTVFGVFHAELK